MALAGSDTALKNMLKSAFNAATNVYSKGGDSDAYLNELCGLMAKAIVNHIAANAEVSTTVIGTSPTGPVTGTGTGKIL